MSVLVIADREGSGISSASLSTIYAATQLGGEVHVLVPSHDENHAKNAASALGVSKVMSVVNAAFEHPLAEDLTDVALSIANQYTHILSPANTFGKNFMPRLAAKLDVAQISDITAIESSDTFKRPIYAGNAITIVQSSDPIKVVTVRPTAFDPAPLGEGCASLETMDFTSNNTLSSFVRQEIVSSARPDLGSAKIVISGGRGMQNAENFKIIERLADRLGAAVGASRAAVDAGFISNEHQVGQTGRVVAPDLYIAIGISGAIQHVAGISDSKVIVAINKDPDAPIFEIADYGLVADFFEILPELEAGLEKLGY